MPLRILYFGTAELACASLNALVRNKNFELLGVVTQPDKARGRDMQIQFSAVKDAALAAGLKVLQPRRARDESFIAEVRSLAPELMVVVAYGQILPQALLDLPAHGCLNVHTSLLPRHRGAAPIQWAILSGDPETGVTIMKMDAGLDTGPILMERRTPINPADTAQTLHDRLAVMGAELLVETIPLWVEGKIDPRPQPEGATYARKISKADGQIDWKERPIVIWRKIRAFTPWPGAFSTVELSGKKRLVKLWEAVPRDRQGTAGTVLEAAPEGITVGCGEGSLQINVLQVEGRKRMSAREFLSGHHLEPGEVFA
jgi:methionyl-tRNA formyltransferase